MLEPGMFESSLEAHEDCAGKMKGVLLLHSIALLMIPYCKET